MQHNGSARQAKKFFSGFSTLELKLGLRLIRKQPILAGVAILALGLGIAIATTGFSLMDSVLHGELPFPGGERFVRFQVSTVPAGHRAALDLDLYQLLAEQAESYAHLGAITAGEHNLLHPDGTVDSVNGARITPSTFQHLPYAPRLGRTLLPEDGVRGAPPVVLLRESLWQRRYRADPEILGRRLHIHGVERTVVGILPDGATFPADGELWIPLNERTLDADASGRHQTTVFGILQPGTTLAEADREAQRFAEQLQATVAAQGRAAAPGTVAEPSTVAAPGQAAPERDTRLRVTSYVEAPEQATVMATMMNLLLVAVLAVIASNVANLILTRTAYRRGELAVRSALGAGRGRLIGQLTVEMALLGVLAMALGLAVATYAVATLDRLLTELPFWIELTISARTLAYVVGITGLIVLVSGVLPALKATGRDPLSTLNASGRGGNFRLGRFSAAMMVLEMALSVAMLSGSLVLARGFSAHSDQDFGLPLERVLTAQVRIPAHLRDNAQAATETPSADETVRRRVALALEQRSEITAVGLTSALPRQDAGERQVVIESPAVAGATVAGAADAAGTTREPRPAPVATVTPGFFAALDVEATVGRLLQPLDLAPDAPAVAVVNQPFVDRFLAGRQPLDRRLRLVDPEDPTAPPRWHRIVGVVPDLGLSAADPERAAGVYLPMTQAPPWLYLTLRGHDAPERLAGPLRAAVTSVHAEIQLRRVQPLADVNADERDFMTAFSQSMIGMGVTTLVLALLGIYAMISFAVTQRTREIGIRVALGASHRQIFAAVTAGASLYLALGAVLGAAAATAYIRLQDSMLVTRLPTGEPWVVPAVIALLAAAGFTACWLPARRALAILPTEALRFE
ncbi:MAG: ABC transporter permease [Acidobacteriota bacterium]